MKLDEMLKDPAFIKMRNGMIGVLATLLAAVCAIIVGINPLWTLALIPPIFAGVWLANKELDSRPK